MSGSLRNYDAGSEIDRVLSSERSEVTNPQIEEFYRVSVPCFEGPLDLLLHLIRKDQINVYDIPITKICKSYLEHLDLMQRLDLNVAGEFMVMASTLIYLKSATMLPVDKEDEDDPRKPLVAQLLEYERFKKASEKLDQIPWMGRDLYARPPTALIDVLPEEALLSAPLEPIETFQLLLQLRAALSRTERPTIQLQVDTTSLRDKVAFIGELLEVEDTVDFLRLLPRSSTKKETILSFLAMLELAKLKFIEVIQNETYGPIQLRAVRNMRELNMGLLDQY